MAISPASTRATIAPDLPRGPTPDPDPDLHPDLAPHSDLASKTLADGTVLAVRRMRPEDADAVIDGFHRLSERSFRRRFFGPQRRLWRKEAAALTILHDDHLIVLAHTQDGSLIGGARVVRSIDGHSGDIALTVGDRWQGQGVGTLLARRIVVEARDAGIDMIRGLVRVDNEPARAMLRGAGATEWFDEPEVRGFEIPLTSRSAFDAELYRHLGPDTGTVSRWLDSRQY